MAIGSSAANVLEGGAGNDRLTGGGASDTFVSKPGFFDADTIRFQNVNFHTLTTAQIAADFIV